MIKSHVHALGTVNCHVKFRLTREQFNKVAEYFGCKAGLRFATCEVFCQGNGWYIAYSNDSELVDGALRALQNIAFVLEEGDQFRAWLANERENEKLRQQRIARAYKLARKVFVPCTRFLAHGRCHTLAKNRLISATVNKVPERIRYFRELARLSEMARPPMPVAITQDLVASLNAKFGH